MAYHHFKADDGSEYGSFETFHHDGSAEGPEGTMLDDDGYPLKNALEES